MRNLILSLFIILSSLSLKAQDEPISFYTSAGAAFGIGSLSDYATLGGGLGVQGVYHFSENIEAFAQLSFYYFASNPKTNITTHSESFTYHVPAIVGARANISNFLIGLGAGYGSYSLASNTTGGITFNPQVGYNLDKYEIILHYSTTAVSGGDLNFIGLKFNYKVF